MAHERSGLCVMDWQIAAFIPSYAEGGFGQGNVLVICRLKHCRRISFQFLLAGYKMHLDE